jgi:hypothetical protein
MQDYKIPQPMLFDFYEPSTSTLELFPMVWRAAEELTSPDVQIRLAALDSLLELDAPRLSPLVAYVLATRIIDPDLELRYRVIRAIGRLLSLDTKGNVTPEPVRQHLRAYLSQMSRRGILDLLEIGEKFPSAESEVASLLNICSHAGGVLAEIVADRRAPLGMRRQAVHYIGRVGFLSAISTLERVSGRIESRLSGQKAMPFAPPSAPDEVALLPSIQTALNLLHQP